MIMEYAPYGNLRDLLRKHRPDNTSQDQTCSVGKETLSHTKDSSKPHGFDIVETSRPVTPKDLLSFAFQVARGMEYLSSRSVRIQVNQIEVIKTLYLLILSSVYSPHILNM